MTMTSIMRSFKGLRILLILSILLLGVGEMWAGSNGYYYYYYAKVTAKTATASTGQGTVYVSTTAASVDNATSETSSATGQDPNNYGTTTDAPSEAGQVAFYLYAKPASGYKFDGWSSSSTRPAVFESTNSVWETTFGASTTQGSNTTTNPGGTQNSGTTKSSGKTQYYSTSTATYSVYAYFSEIVSSFTVSFAQPSHGSIKVGGVSPSSWPYEVSTTTGELTTTLTATPASGYSFWGWYTLNTDGSKNYLSYDASYNATFNDAATVYAEFYSSSLALFQVAGVNFYDLNLANAKAVANGGGAIIVTKDGTVPAGNYTIASDVTLLVPLNADNQVNTTPSTVTSGTPSRKVYRTLTLAKGVNITLNGSICVNAIMCLTMGYNGSAMNGYGLINMEEGSTITMKYGSNIYAWGYIIGSGSIIAESGATTYEAFQFKHRGGNALSSITNSSNSSKKVFPINQYYIQNIEVPITFNKGAKEIVYTGVHNTSTPVSIEFIGESGLFTLTGNNACIVKRYDVSKDRQNYTLSGDATIGSIKFGMSGFYKESKDFVLPITNNMTLNVESGTTTIQYETAILPDVELNIAQSAKISTSANCYVYDSLNWKGAYAYACQYAAADQTTNQIAPVVYRHGGLKYNRKNYKLRDATVNVNGTFEGKIYTTTGGANIKSSLGTGVVKFTAARTATTTYQVGQDGTTPTFDAYTVESAQLHNSNAFKTTYGADFEYLSTVGSAANTTINYKNGHWGWVEVWKDEDGTILKTLNTCTQQSGTAPTPPTPANMTFEGWSTVTSTANQEVVHTATYASPSYTITWVLDGKTVKTEDVAYGETPSYGSTPTKPSTERYDYKFSGWTPDITPVTGPQTYSGSFKATPRQYTIRFLNDDESVLQESSVDWGSQPVYAGATPQSTIVDGWFRRFVGWSPEVQLVETAVDYTAQYELVTLLDVPDEQTIPVDASVTTTTVYVTGALHVTESKTLTTEDLILKATPTTSGEILGRVTAANAYFDLSQDGDESHLFEAMRWYAVAVPWAVDAASGVSVNGATLTLGRDYDIIYYDGAVRAARGRVDACWRYVRSETDKTLLPGRAYMLILLRSGAKTLRFTRNGNVLHTESVGIRTYTLQTGNLNDANWNGIANPETYHAWLKMTTDVDQLVDGHLPHKLHFGQTYNADLEQYELVDLSLDASQLVVGKPIYVQATTNQTAEACVNKVDAEFAAAPRRARTDATESPYYDIHIAADGRSSDHIYIHTEEDKDDAYVLGADLSRFSVSSKVAQLWINRYDTRLCVNTTTPVNGSAVWSLGLSVPEAGEYQLYVATPVAEDDNLYLTYDGRVIWNLGHAPYTVALEAGQSEHYGLRLIHSAPDMEMDVDRVEATDAASVRKVLIDNRVYILRGAQLYTPAGQLLR